MSRLFFVFDVESVGFHGEAYAVGFCVVDEGGQEHGYGRYACDPSKAAGDMAGHQWVAANATFPATVNCRTIQEVRDHFISAYNGWRTRGVIFAADYPFPVEARFLLECYRDFPEQVVLPCPLIDVASVVLAAGWDPFGTFPRLGEFKHDPLADARQSARILVESLAKTHTASATVSKDATENIKGVRKIKSGQIVKIDGIPFELLADVNAYSKSSLDIP